MKSTKNGIVVLVVVINLQDEPVHLKKTYWILYHQQCDRLVIVPSVPEVVRPKMVCQSKDTPHQEVVLSGLLMTSAFMLDK